MYEAYFLGVYASAVKRAWVFTRVMWLFNTYISWHACIIASRYLLNERFYGIVFEKADCHGAYT
jgi:hypothetical protein